MENVVLDEEFYQNFKKEIWKKDDYLSIEEYKKLRLNYAYYKNNELVKNRQSVLNTMERVVGIEPTLSGRKHDILPLNYTRIYNII